MISARKYRGLLRKTLNKDRRKTKPGRILMIGKGNPVPLPKEVVPTLKPLEANKASVKEIIQHPKRGRFKKRRGSIWPWIFGKFLHHDSEWGY
ncbi:MAG: hypothetical protein ACFFCW_45545 [Candidatus Hodarchaeota archaeon]